jgi:cAMP-dependent protein kinase regulator
MAFVPSPELLRRIPLFRHLDDAELGSILRAGSSRTLRFAPMQDIIREGEAADSMYVLLEGLVEVRIAGVDGREVAIASLKAGEFFGEQALLSGGSGRRNATVRAVQPTSVLQIARATVNASLSKSPENLFPQLGGVEGVAELDATTKVRDLLRSSRLFRSLSEGDLMRLQATTEILRPRPGEVLLREGSRGDYLYMVMEGVVEIFVMDNFGKVILLARLETGSYFGEQALIPSGPGVRNANARAGENLTLVRIAPDLLQGMLERDRKLGEALKLIGDAQRKKIADLRAADDSW